MSLPGTARPFSIGPHRLECPLALAPMAGVTDPMFRRLCRDLGADYVVSEMLSANPALRNTHKSRLRSAFAGEAAPFAVQIAGSDPAWMAEAARYNVDRGARIIDINMGCPARKVCNTLAGSALLSDPALVRAILEAVVKAVDVPVTLKIRTGPDRGNRNGVLIARIAEESGVALLAVHGRTRADRFEGEAEYATIAAIVAAVRIPVLANGDIDTPHKAAVVLAGTGAAGLMIGRAAQGNPWIFREVRHFLQHGSILPSPAIAEIREIIFRHLDSLYAGYGEPQGLRIARKHIGWYLHGKPGAAAWRAALMRCETASGQRALLDGYFSGPAGVAVAPGTRRAA